VWRIAANWICGIEEHPEIVLTEDQKKAMDDAQTSLKEVPFQRRLCNINALILMTVTALYIGFFA